MAAETIIESFCERCGTRYTFEPVRKRESKLVGLGKSLGILLDDQARSLASRDPFHGTFHFCLECRQYTCPTCWNEDAGFCLGCVPLPDAPDTASFDAAEAAATMEATSYRDDSLAAQAALDDPDAWPDADLHRRRLEALQLGAAAAVMGAAPDPVDGPLGDDDSWSLTFEPGTPGEDVEIGPDAVVTDATDDAADARTADAEHDHALLTVAAAATLADADDRAATDEQDDATVQVADAAVELAADAEPEAEPVAEAEAAADVEAEPVAEAEDAADVEAVLEAEPVAEAEAAADAEAVLEAEPVAEAEAAADAEAVLEAEPVAEAEAAADVEAAADMTPDAPLAPAPLAAAVVVAAAVATQDDDLEADWAHLLGHLPTEDDVVPDDWAAMAPALGPDIAPASLPDAIPSVPPPAVQPPPVQAPVAQAPVAPPPVATSAWQLTAPAADAESRSTAWPPLGPVFRPTAAPVPAPTTPHPSVMAQRGTPQGVMARGHQVGGVQLPKGVRPCVSCELPLSASARFCRRCGRPQG